MSDTPGPAPGKCCPLMPKRPGQPTFRAGIQCQTAGPAHSAETLGKVTSGPMSGSVEWR